MAHGGSGMFPSSTHSSGDLCGGGVWCGGGLGKQRMAQPQRRKQRARRELFLLRRSVWRRWWRFGVKEAEEALVFFLHSLVFFLRLERDLSESTWQEFIGWRKTLVLRHSLIERFLNEKCRGIKKGAS